MFKKILLMFRAGWLCQAVTKLISGFTSAITVLNFVIKEISGSPLGAQVLVYLQAIKDLLESALNVLTKIGTFVCGVEAVAEAKTQSVESALRNIRDKSTDLKKL